MRRSCFSSGMVIFFLFAAIFIKDTVTFEIVRTFENVFSDAIDGFGFNFNRSPSDTVQRLHLPHRKKVDKIQPKQIQCGVSNVVGMYEKVIGGEDAPPHKFPWMMRLWTIGLFGLQFRCGASLINNFFVITASHCVQGYRAHQLVLSAGIDNYCTNKEKPWTMLNIEMIYTPGEWDENDGSRDVALLKLRRPIAFTNTIKPICLPADPQNRYSDLVATIAGWGITNLFTQSIPCQLQQTAVKIFSEEQCISSSRYNPMLDTDDVICAGSLRGGKDSCQGDSGGPLMFQRSDSSQYEIIGIVSRGHGCGEAGYLGLYTRVTTYLGWIKSITRKTPFY